MLLPCVLSKHLEDKLLILDVLDALGLVNGSLWHDFESTELSIDDDQVDRSKLPVSYLHARVFVEELLLGWLLRFCTLFLFFFSGRLGIATADLLDWREFS